MLCNRRATTVSNSYSRRSAHQNLIFATYPTGACQFPDGGPFTLGFFTGANKCCDFSKWGVLQKPD